MGVISPENVLLEMITKPRIAVFLMLGTLVLTAVLLPVFAQTPAPGSRERPFEPTEELTYKAEFSRALLRKLDVANFRFTVNRVAGPNKPKTGNAEISTYTLRLTGDVQSQGFFAKLFGINFRQQVESTVEPESFEVQKTTRLDEQGKRVRSSEAVFDHERGQVTWIERDPRDPSRPERTVTAKFEEPIQDVLSAIYFLRLSELEPGKRFDLPVSDSGKVYHVSIAVIEKKRMKTPLGRVSVIRVDPQLFGPQGMIGEEGKLSIWLTDDQRRIPVSARLKTAYGTFDITLKKASQPNAQIVSAGRE